MRKSNGFLTSLWSRNNKQIRKECDLRMNDKSDVRQKIIEILGKIEDEQLLNRIYRFVKYIYLHKS